MLESALSWIWAFLVDSAPVIGGFVLRNSAAIIGLVILSIVFWRANESYKRKEDKRKPIIQPSGISIVRMYDTVVDGERSWCIVIRNNEEVDLYFEMDANIGGYTGFVDRAWSGINLVAGYRGDRIVEAKKQTTLEIARTTTKDDGFWIQSSGHMRKGRGFYIFGARLTASRNRGGREYSDEMLGYFIFRGENDLEFGESLPDDEVGR